MKVTHLEKGDRPTGGQSIDTPSMQAEIDRITNLGKSQALPSGVVPDAELNEKPEVANPTSTSALNSSSALSGIPITSIADAEKLAEGWVQQDFPSLSIPYKGRSIHIKPLEVMVLSKVHAAQHAKSLKQLLDALQPCIDMDIRELTVPDFYFFMYWLRINSYPKSPMTLEWVSKYGNKNKTRVDMSSFNVIEATMTREEYAEWESKGFTFPRIRDMEILQLEVTEDKRWLETYAQYVALDGEVDETYMQRKVDKFVGMGVDAMADVEEFSSKIGHGVVEEVTVTDSKFDLAKAVEHMSMEIDNLSRIVRASMEEDDVTAMTNISPLVDHIAARTKERDELKQKLEEGVVVTPDKEVVALGTPDATLLFPGS